MPLYLIKVIQFKATVAEQAVFEGRHRRCDSGLLPQVGRKRTKASRAEYRVEGPF
jgi:hypothetical protein